MGIATAVYYPLPLNQQPAYAHLCGTHCTPIALDVAQRVMSLPMGEQSNQQKIIANLLRFKQAFKTS